MTAPDLDRRDFAEPAALAEALAGRVAEALRAAIAERDGASLAVSGGTTPARLFDALSRKELDWAKVVVTLVDERFVPPTSDRSNEKLVRDALLRNQARQARFVPLAPRGALGAARLTDAVESAARSADAAIALLPQPLDVAVLGMGTDGHTASFFPDASELDRLLDPSGRQRVMAVHAPSAGESRLTMTLPVIAAARLLVLHIEGAAKREVLEAALAAPAEAAPPVRAVLAHAAARPVVFWAPSEGDLP